jgi:hypothetical protein
MGLMVETRTEYKISIGKSKLMENVERSRETSEDATEMDLEAGGCDIE